MSKTLSDEELRNTLLLDILHDTNVSGHHIEKIISLIHKQTEAARIDENDKWLDVYAESGDDITQAQLSQRVFVLQSQEGDKTNE